MLFQLFSRQGHCVRLTEEKKLYNGQNRIFFRREINLAHRIISALDKPFPNKPWFLLVCSTGLLKTLWKKEKLLVTNNFSFSHSVFYPFPTVFSTLFEKFLPLSSKLELSSAKSFSLEASKICR